MFLTALSSRRYSRRTRRWITIQRIKLGLWRIGSNYQMCQCVWGCRGALSAQSVRESRNGQPNRPSCRLAERRKSPALREFSHAIGNGGNGSNFVQSLQPSRLIIQKQCPAVRHLDARGLLGFTPLPRLNGILIKNSVVVLRRRGRRLPYPRRGVVQAIQEIFDVREVALDRLIEFRPRRIPASAR